MSTESPPPPTVSVLIAVFNGEQTLALQLKAIAAQTYDGPLEVVVADNGSTDGTRALVTSLSEQLDLRIEMVDASARRGAPFALNRAAEAASGDLFLICDADDIATETWVEQMVRELQNDDFVAGALLPFIQKPGDWHTEEYRSNVDDWHGYCPIAATANVGLRRGTFEILGGIDERLLAAYDVDLAARAHEHGIHLGSSPGAMWYRQREGSVAWAKNLAWCVSWDIAVQESRRAALEAAGAYQSFPHCVRQLGRHILDPRRWPRSASQRTNWISQTRIKWGRVRGHLLKRRRLRLGD